MKLYQLAIACWAFGGLTAYERTYQDFRKNIKHRLNFEDPAHLSFLLDWLRRWGCRQFETDPVAEEIAKESIRAWAQEWVARLPDRNVALDQMSVREIERAAEAYASLKKRKASNRKTVGPTGASKILFAARPRSLPPWDEAIRAKYKSEEEGYRSFLLNSREEVFTLKRDTARLGISPERIPESIGRPHSTICELVNAHTWITVTAEFKVPTPEQLAQWQRWSKGARTE